MWPIRLLTSRLYQSAKAKRRVIREQRGGDAGRNRGLWELCGKLSLPLGSQCIHDLPRQKEVLESGVGSGWGGCGGVSSATSEGQPGLSSLRVEKKRFIHLVDYDHLTIFYFINFSCDSSTESERYVASVHLTVITIYNYFYVFISGHSCFTVPYHDLASTAGQLDVLRTQHFEYIKSASYIYDYYYYCCFMLLPICLSCDWVIG